MLVKRRAVLVLTVFLLHVCMFMVACSSSQANEPVADKETTSIQLGSKGVNFAGNKAPSVAYFGDREFEQPTYDAAALRDEYVTDVDPGSYTLMIYLDGSDLENPDGGSCPASATIGALARLDIDPAKVRIVVFTGGSKSWGHPGLEGDGNYIISYEASSTGEELDIIRHGDVGNRMNMGDPKTLSSFLDYAVKEYPAEHYALVFWDHGGGPLVGCELDENTEDTLMLTELDEAFRESPFGKGKKLDWIGFDCCLMAHIELAAVLDDYAYYMVASQESECCPSRTVEHVERYGSSWVYDFVNVLNETSSPVKVGVHAIDRFAYGQENIISDTGTNVEYTQSLIDLGKIDDVSSAMDELFYAMKRDLERGSFEDLSRIRSYVKEYAEGAGYDLVDLGYLAWAYEDLYPTEAASLKQTISDLVMYQRTNVAEATGVSLYYPYTNENLYETYASGYEDLNVSDGYVEYLGEFTDVLVNGEGNVDWMSDDRAEEADVPHSNEVVSSGSVESDDGIESTASSSSQSDMDNPAEFGSDSDAGSDSPSDDSDSEDVGGEREQEGEYAIQLTEEQQKSISHVSYNVLMKGDDNDRWSGGSEMYRMLLQDCRVAADENGVIHIAKRQSLLSLVGEDGRQTVWPFKQVACGAQVAKYQSLATTLDGPFGAMAWTDSVPVTINVIERLGLSDLEISAITYRDDADKVLGKDDADMERYDYLYNWVQPCKPEGDANTPAWTWEQWDGVVASGLAVESTPKIGVVPTSELQGDYVLQVVFTDVQGNESVLGLYELESAPKPEKKIESVGSITYEFEVYRDHAALVEAQGSVEELTIPDECGGQPVTEICDAALRNCNAKSVIVPGSVKTVGSNVFASTLEEAILSEGVEKLSAQTFAGCKELAAVTMPETLTSIGDGAFRGCDNLKSLELPANLTHIGDGAFEECPRLRELKLAQGSTLFKIEENEDGNVLFNADGSELIACPGLFHSSYTVPEGTISIRDRAFNGSYSESIGGSAQSDGHAVVGYGLVEIIFPDTLKKIGDAAFFECNRLKAIDLPAGLECIGMQAFGSTDLTGTIGLGSIRFEKDAIGKVTIGKNVRWIGQGAFNSFEVKEFAVEKGNWHYTTKNGRLMTRDGRTEVDVYGERA